MTPTAQNVKPLRSSWHRLRYAYHEAGHAVLGHWFGRCLAEVSIVPDTATEEFFEHGLRGHCLFDIFAEADHAVLGWQPGDRNPALIAILFGGVYASVNACDEHGWQVHHWNHGFGRDVAAIEHVIERMDIPDGEREAVKAEQEQLALDLVLEFWPAIAHLARTLAERGKLAGHEAHDLIQEILGPAHADWRMESRW